MYFTGYQSQEEISIWLSIASIYVAPVKYEPFGLSVLEAGLSGCALVTGNIPSMNELWEDAATKIDPNNAHELIETINHLINDDLWSKQKMADSKLHASRYTSMKMAREYFNTYKDLVGIDILTKDYSEIIELKH